MELSFPLVIRKGYYIPQGKYALFLNHKLVSYAEIGAEIPDDLIFNMLMLNPLDWQAFIEECEKKMEPLLQGPGSGFHKRMP